MDDLFIPVNQKIVEASIFTDSGICKLPDLICKLFLCILHAAGLVEENIAFFQFIGFLQIRETLKQDGLDISVVHAALESFIVLRIVVEIEAMTEDILELCKKIPEIFIFGVSSAPQTDSSEGLSEMFENVKGIGADESFRKINLSNDFIRLVEINRDISDIVEFAFSGLFIVSIQPHFSKIAGKIIFFSVRKHIDDGAVLKIHQKTAVERIIAGFRKMVFIDRRDFRQRLSGDIDMGIKDALDFGGRKMIAGSRRSVGIIDELEILENIDLGFKGYIFGRIDERILFKESHLTRITSESSAFIKDGAFSVDKSGMDQFS